MSHPIGRTDYKSIEIVLKIEIARSVCSAVNFRLCIALSIRDRFDRDGYRDRRDHSTRAERERVREAEANVRRMGSSPVPAAPSRGPRPISEGRDSRTQTPGSNGSRDRGNNRDDR